MNPRTRRLRRIRRRIRKREARYQQVAAEVHKEVFRKMKTAVEDDRRKKKHG